MLRPVLFLIPVLTAAAADFKIGEHTFTVAEGYTIERVAGPPLVNRPITMACDESGALYVADSSGSNDKVEKQLAEKPHRIVRLTDRNGDGIFDGQTVFADKMMFPEGTMWLDGSLFVSAPPQIWKLTDTNGDGVADERKVWFDGKTLTGCANDLHGPYGGPDGYIYWCKGAFAEQRHHLADGRLLVTKASHVFRARPDGTGLEVVMTGGMDNPVDVVFTRTGEPLVCGTFFVHPGGGQRDGILHAAYGGVFGKDHAVLNGHVRTGELLPVMTHLGPAAPSGLEIVRSAALGSEWPGNLLACQFNLRKVSRHVLRADGATFKTTDSDFVVSDQADFHPTDVLEDADGSILICDTGGWYKLCCPTSQLHKPDVLGGIYRVRREGGGVVADARGLQMDWTTVDTAALAARLNDPRPAVVDRAIAQLAKQGEEAVTHLAAWIHTPRPGNSDKPVTARLNAIWALTRIPGEAARSAVRFAFADREASVRTAAAHSAGLWRDRGSVEALINQLANADLHLRRAAAQALGRMGEPAAAAALARAAGPKADRFLEHALAYALIELRADAAASAAVLAGNSGAVRVGLVALDQLGKLEPTQLLRALGSSDDETVRLAEWIAAHHADWGESIAQWLRERIQQAESAQFPALQNLLTRLASNAAVQALVGDLASDTKTPAGLRSTAFGVMQGSGLRDLPASWAAAIEQAVAEPGELTETALAAAQAFARAKGFPASLRGALEKLIADGGRPGAQRVTAVAAIPGSKVTVSDDLLSLLLSEVQSTELMRARKAAAQLARAELSSAQFAVIAAHLAQATPAALPALLEPFRARKDEATGKLLVEQLGRIEALPAGVVRSILASYPESVRVAAEPALNKGTLASTRDRLDQLARILPNGDVRRGHQLFRSTRSACTTCHAMAYVGGNLGPDLTRIGSVRTERDLLEAIVFPAASFVRSYEPVLVKTRNGGEHLGILKKEDANEVVLATGPGTETRLARGEVKSMEPAEVSLMPQGYDGIFNPQELADLVAFLKAAK